MIRSYLENCEKIAGVILQTAGVLLVIIFTALGFLYKDTKFMAIISNYLTYALISGVIACLIPLFIYIYSWSIKSSGKRMNQTQQSIFKWTTILSVILLALMICLIGLTAYKIISDFAVSGPFA